MSETENSSASEEGVYYCIRTSFGTVEVIIQTGGDKRKFLISPAAKSALKDIYQSGELTFYMMDKRGPWVQLTSRPDLRDIKAFEVNRNVTYFRVLHRECPKDHDHGVDCVKKVSYPYTTEKLTRTPRSSKSSTSQKTEKSGSRKYGSRGSRP